MAKHTDRYENQNIIDLAKKDYESKQQHTVPAEIVSLTSRGKVYPKNHPLRSGKIEMRYMTAYDEDILTNASYLREGIVLNKLIEALIVSDINYDDLAMVDKDGLILNARLLSYGAEYAVTVNDPKTGTSLDRVVDLSKLKTKTLDINSNDNGEFTYESKKHNIKFIFPTTTTADSTETTSEYLKSIIVEANGSRKDEDIDNFLRYEFLAKDSKEFQKFVMENTPTVLLECEFEGEDGSTFEAGFPIGPNFFWL